MRQDRNHVIARRLLGITLHHIAANFGVRDFDMSLLVEAIAIAIDDEITATVQQAVADLSQLQPRGNDNE